MTTAYEAKLIRTCVDADPHTLVFRRSHRDRTPFALLADDDPDDVLGVTFDRPAGFLEDWTARVGTRPRRVGVVGVGDRMRSTAASAGSDSNAVRGVADPTDGAAIRAAAADYLDAWPDDGRAVVCFDSATALLEHRPVNEAADFLVDFRQLLDEHGAAGYVCLDPSAHDSDAVRTIGSLFDTVVECLDGGATGGSE
ncbi:DUF7504 family protein [Halorussus marinus]|uniref:DUF7504 family protein n=1 Tax=Halorussus marinus TaxID=2505976 RepID=UPI00106F04B2|nr:hypothetical protein [Halorussus marinus]